MNLNFPIFNSRSIITLHQFLTNPTGSRSSFVGKNKEIKENLNMRYKNILSKNNGKLYNEIYYDNKGHTYWFYFKIPSETFDELYYDVVLEFVPDKREYENNSLIEDYSINFFSNSPHMMFTYTYVLKENKITVPSLEKAKKYSKTALTKKPKVTNPVQIFGFEKSCYYACKYIDDNKLYKKELINKNLKIIKTNKDIINFYNSIKSQEAKFEEYTKLKEKKKKERDKKVSDKNKKYLADFNKRNNARKNKPINKVIKKMAVKPKLSKVPKKKK
jgi:hypothetical protein